MFGFGASELIIVLLLIFVFFGARRLPEIGQGIGKGIRNYREAAKDTLEEEGPEQKKEQ